MFRKVSAFYNRQKKNSSENQRIKSEMVKLRVVQVRRRENCTFCGPKINWRGDGGGGDSGAGWIVQKQGAACHH